MHDVSLCVCVCVLLPFSCLQWTAQPWRRRWRGLHWSVTPSVVFSHRFPPPCLWGYRLHRPRLEDENRLITHKYKHARTHSRTLITGWLLLILPDSSVRLAEHGVTAVLTVAVQPKCIYSGFSAAGDVSLPQEETDTNTHAGEKKKIIFITHVCTVSSFLSLSLSVPLWLSVFHCRR